MSNPLIFRVYLDAQGNADPNTLTMASLSGFMESAYILGMKKEMYYYEQELEQMYFIHLITANVEEPKRVYYTKVTTDS